MGPKRRPHRKSRGGCRECRRRRIKCDEEKPQCFHCVRHSISCIYPPTAGYPSPQSDSSRQSSGQTGSPEILTYVTRDTIGVRISQTDFDIKDLALFHHWILITSKSIVNTAMLNDVWQTILPEIGFQHPSLMHSILSLAALHVAYLKPANRHSILCDAALHHNEAIRGFREGIDHIGPDNSDALFANAILSFFYAFVTFGKLYDSCGEDASAAARTSRILGAEWIPLVRGVEVVLHPVYEHVRTGALSSLLGIDNWEELDCNVSSNPYDDQMLQIREIWREGENAEIYDETLHLLRKCSAWMAQFDILQGGAESRWGYNRNWSGPFIWLFLAPERYIVLQRQRQPPALVIFAYFGAILQSLDGYWWMEGCGKSIVGVVDECLGPYWSPWTKWPKEIVGLS